MECTILIIHHVRIKICTWEKYAGRKKHLSGKKTSHFATKFLQNTPLNVKYLLDDDKRYNTVSRSDPDPDLSQMAGSGSEAGWWDPIYSVIFGPAVISNLRWILCQLCCWSSPPPPLLHRNLNFTNSIGPKIAPLVHWPSLRPL